MGDCSNYELIHGKVVPDDNYLRRHVVRWYPFLVHSRVISMDLASQSIASVGRRCDTVDPLVSVNRT